MGAGRRVDELSCDAYPTFGLTDAAFDDVAHAKFASDLLLVYRPALVGEARVARDHEQPADARQGRDDLFYDAVGKIVLFDVATEVSNGRTAIEGESGSASRVGAFQPRCPGP